MTQEKALDLLGEFISALHFGHELIEGFLRGEQLNTNQLENYYDGVFSALRKADHEGALVSKALRDLSEASAVPEAFLLMLEPQEETTK